MKKGIITVGVIIASFAGLFLILSNNKAKNVAQTTVVADKDYRVPVREEMVSMKEMSLKYVANGVFAPNREVFISTEVPGNVQQVLVKEGQVVSAGQTLAVVKGDQQKVSLANAEAMYNDALKEVERFESAYKTGGVSQQQLDQMKLQLVSAKNNYESAKLNAGNVNIKASFSGIINAKYIEVGSYVNPGQQLFEVVDINKLKLKVSIDEKTIGSLAVGQKVSVFSSVFSDKKWEGTITFIAPKADGSMNFPIEIEVQNSDLDNLKAGMYGSAIFGEDQTVNALVIPRISFINNVSSQQVFINDNGNAKLVNVNTGRDFGEYIEILSGLKEGDKVITTGQINLFDNTAIETIK